MNSASKSVGMYEVVQISYLSKFYFSCSYINNCKELMDETFTNLFCSTLSQVGKVLIQRIEDILDAVSECEQGLIK